MKLGAFVDVNRPRHFAEDEYILPETPPFSWLLRKTKEEFGEDAARNSETVITTKINGESERNKENIEELAATAKEDLKEQMRTKNDINAKLIETSSAKPSRWSISPTLDDQKLLKELVRVIQVMILIPLQYY